MGNTARKLDKLMLDDRKETVEKNWLQKAAEEADLILSASSDDENEFTCSKSQLKADLKSKIKVAKAELNSLLATPMHTQSFAGMYEMFLFVKRASLSNLLISML